jgi:hypothetical protein
LGAALIDAGRRRPELFNSDERTLWKTLKDEGKLPNATDNRLRLKFWNEYDRAQAEQNRMDMIAVYSGVCSREYFSKRYVQSAEKLAWLMCPPASYEVKMEEALAFGIEQLRDILELPNVGATGKLDVKLMELKAKIVAMMDVRVKGAVVQKVEQKNMNLNISTSNDQVAKRAMAGSMAELEARLKELDKKDRLAAPKEIVIE